jgi:hypothetical protein
LPHPERTVGTDGHDHGDGDDQDQPSA